MKRHSMWSKKLSSRPAKDYRSSKTTMTAKIARKPRGKSVFNDKIAALMSLSRRMSKTWVAATQLSSLLDALG